MEVNKIIDQASDIIKGHVNEIFNNNEELYQARISICEQCPLITYTNLGPICNNKLWINPKTNETSEEAKKGYVRGCSCRLNAKTRNKDNHCIINKW